MPYFDFHVHSGLKPAFADQQEAPSPWDFIEAKLAIFKDVTLRINPLFNEALNSQSSLKQLADGEVKLVGLALHAPEANMAKGLLQKKIVNKGKIKIINRERLEIIASGNHYFQLITEELARLTKPYPAATTGGNTLVILNNASDYKEEKKHNLYGFLLIEGLHCFMGNQSAPDRKEIYKANFESFTDTNTVISINICHIQQNDFCNHAYGIQFIDPSLFFPIGKGLTAWGKEMIERMLEKKILADIKHMSLISRLQFYNLLKNHDAENEYTQPILCTHAGLTGQSMLKRTSCLLHQPKLIEAVYEGQAVKVYELVHGKPKSPHITSEDIYFNNSSINLYDEDIEAILLSNGLIGLSLDQRIIGFADENVLKDVTTPHDLEYISELEAKEFLGPNPAALPVTTRGDLWAAEDFANLDPSLTYTLHPLFILNHVLHILWVAKQNPAIGITKAMEQICLGSDFDGLINAIDSCKNVTGYKNLHAFFVENLPQYLKEADLENEGINVPVFAEKICYSNGKNFILNRLKAMGKA